MSSHEAKKLDVHKVRTQYCLVREDGCLIEEGSVGTGDVARLIDRPGMAMVLEATGNWCAVYDALVAAGAEVKLAHPARVKAIASARIKTDKIDARILAHLLRADLIPAVWAPPGEGLAGGDGAGWSGPPCAPTCESWATSGTFVARNR